MYWGPPCYGYWTLHRENINGPRIHVIVNAARRPRKTLQIRLHTGEDYELEIEYECTPKYCTKCRSFGHLENGCMGPKDSIHQPQRKGMAGTKRRTNDRGNNGVTLGQMQPNLNRQPASRPRRQAQWRPTGNVVGAEDLVHGPPKEPILGQVATITAFASPNNPISFEEDHIAPDNPALVKTNGLSSDPGLSGVPKEQNDKDYSISTVDMIVNKTIAKGTPYVNGGKKRSTTG